MKYLCALYFEESKVAGLSPEEMKALVHDAKAYEDELEERGHLIVARALEGISQAVTVRVRDGRMSATDGPFAETREALGGFILINAADLNEAIQIAAGIPVAKLGSIEVRPIVGSS